MHNSDEYYMQRCIGLAQLGAGRVAPNPMVGAVLVYQDRIIGEGYHMKFGEAHAEVNCLHSVKEEDRPLITKATLYVSLEPCAHTGKTPPCSQLIIREQIPKVVIGCLDPFAAVNGKGLVQLQSAGIETVTGVCEADCIALNKRFFCFHTKKRPYITLKWAQTAEGKIAGNGDERLMISNEITNRLVHRWRSEEAAILVGTQTALLDNPTLDNRLWEGPAPVRLVLDKQMRLPNDLKVFNGQQKTIVFHSQTSAISEKVEYVFIEPKEDLLTQILNSCYQHQLNSILVEGGRQLLQSFIDKGLWDEAHVITNESLTVAEGLAAPVLISQQKIRSEKILTDRIDYYQNQAAEKPAHFSNN
jgi:diaminohydroxyphosphoribosylaminopyrimidine deaminase/5-amino-6-(5-phosphoribosylamino)uracil reductase